MNVEPLTFHPGDSKISLPCNSLLAISEQKKSGLILCKPYYAEFVGPGAAVSTPVEEGYTGVVTIGSPILVAAQDGEARQKAYGRRIQWMRWLEKISSDSAATPQARTEKLISSFEAFFGADIVAKIPDEILALLIGVLPQTVSGVRPDNALSIGKNDGIAVSYWEPIAMNTMAQNYQLERSRQPASIVSSSYKSDRILTNPERHRELHSLPYSA